MPKQRSIQELSERQREILQAVVEDYIATAEPVGSRTLTKRHSGINVSPATVRNTMADLEDLGYLSAPHTSAGRVPTPQAIRVYVEQLARRGRLSARDREILQAVAYPTLEQDQDIRQILRDAGRALSALSHQATLVFLPRIDEVVFADIEFLPVREDAVLGLFVAKSGLVQHRVIPVDFVVDRDELRRMSNYLKTLLEGHTLREVRQRVLEAMRQQHDQVDTMMTKALRLGERTLTEAPAADSVFVEGERNFLDKPEFADVGRMRKLLRDFEEKTMLLQLIDGAVQRPVEAQAAEREGTQVVLGADSTLREAKDLAMVVATYGAQGGGAAGQVGVVGPMRMDYSRVIPLVEYTAGVLSDSFGGRGRPEPLVPEDDDDAERID